MYNKSGKKTALTIANDLYTISHSHVGKNNYLYRNQNGCFLFT